MTPEAAAVIARARRSFGVSIAVLLVGLIAVVGALVYRTMNDSGSQDRIALETVTLPAGSSVVSVSSENGAVTLAYRNGGKTFVRLLDARTGDIIGQFEIVSD